MQLHCPHCNNAIELVEADTVEILCPACGSTIQLDAGRTNTWIPTSAPRQVDKYQILEQVGVGAFGTVFKARDVELGRVVALKVPRSGNLSSQDDVDRFLREARHVALLQHPSIVAVHDAGESNGTVYIASDFVHGETLADRLERSRFSSRETAEFVAEVARAVHYAHEQGVIHRDLKPSNILLDAESRPHVMDFGMAKREAGEITVTLDGQVLGTPAYMSPEQARGESHHVDARADVYSLGVILYEMLTGELPFRGNKRMLIVQVLNDEPRAPRRLNDHIPRDLETITLKCMAKNPERRYATAHALADDLERFLRDEPIMARPISRVARFWRLCRRRPLVSGLSAALIVMFSVAFVCITALWIESNRQRDRYEKSFRQARDAVDEYFTQVSENKLLRVPGMQPLRRELLQSALKYYQQFVDERRHDPDMLAELATTYVRMADITTEVGSASDAISLYREAAKLGEQLIRDNPTAATLHAALAQTYNNLANLLGEVGEYDASIDMYHKAIALRQRLLAEYPDHFDYQRDLAESFGNLGVTWDDLGRTAEAMQAYQRALELRKPLAERNPKMPRYQNELASSYNNIGILQADQGDTAAALESHHAARRIREQLVAQHPEQFQLKEFLARTYTHVANLQSDLGETDAAAESYDKAIGLLEPLARDNPAVATFQSELALSYYKRGLLEMNTGQTTAAVASFRKSIAIQEQVAAANPSVTNLQLQLAATHGNFGNLQSRIGLSVEALASHTTARDILQKLADASPSHPGFQRDLANSHEAIGSLLYESGHTEQALESYGRTLEIRQKLADDHPTIVDFQRDLGTIHHNIGAVRQGHEAMRSLERARSIREQLVATHPSVPSYLSDLAATKHTLANTFDQLGRHDDALDMYQQAIAQQRAALQMAPRVTTFRRTLMTHYEEIAKLACRMARHEDALAAARECKALAAGDPVDLYNLACSLALCVAIVERSDSSTPAAERARYADQALDSLRAAVAAGFDDFDHMKTDTDLDPLRNHPEYQDLLKKRLTTTPHK